MLSYLKKMLLSSLIFFVMTCITKVSASAIQYVVVDPGHTPKTLGAMSASGVGEYSFNEEFVNELKEKLEKEQIPFVISNAKNKELSLVERVELTGEHSLFLAIHHDSVQQQYCNLNEKPCSTDYADGYSIFVSPRNIMFRISSEIASSIAKNFSANGLHPSTHHGEAIKGENRKLIDSNGVYEFPDLIVLHKSKSPAILIEIAVITNPNDEKKARNHEFREKMINSIVSALKEYVKPGR